MTQLYDSKTKTKVKWNTGYYNKINNNINKNRL